MAKPSRPHPILHSARGLHHLRWPKVESSVSGYYRRGSIKYHSRNNHLIAFSHSSAKIVGRKSIGNMGRGAVHARYITNAEPRAERAIKPYLEL